MRKHFTYIHCDRCYGALKEGEIHERNIILNQKEHYSNDGRYPMFIHSDKKSYELCEKCAQDYDKLSKEFMNSFCAAKESQKPKEPEDKKKRKK